MIDANKNDFHIIQNENIPNHFNYALTSQNIPTGLHKPNLSVDTTHTTSTFNTIPGNVSYTSSMAANSRVEEATTSIPFTAINIIDTTPAMKSRFSLSTASSVNSPRESLDNNSIFSIRDQEHDTPITPADPTIPASLAVARARQPDTIDEEPSSRSLTFAEIDARIDDARSPKQAQKIFESIFGLEVPNFFAGSRQAFALSEQKANDIMHAITYLTHREQHQLPSIIDLQKKEETTSLNVEREDYKPTNDILTSNNQSQKYSQIDAYIDSVPAEWRDNAITAIFNDGQSNDNDHINYQELSYRIHRAAYEKFIKQPEDSNWI